MNKEGSFPKITPEVLVRREQKIRDVETLVGARLRPPSETDANLYVMRPEELMTRYAKRVEIYRRAIEAVQGSPLTPEEKRAFKNWLIATNGIDQYVTKHLEDEGGKQTLTDDQFLIMQDFLAFLESGNTAGYVKFPTGGGKTVVFVEMAEAMKVPTLVVVPTNDLLTQTEKKFKRFAEGVETGKVGGGHKQFSDQVTIITYDSLADKVESGEINPADYACLILDEAHEALSARRMTVVNRFQHAIRIGFSATPDYSADKRLSNLLPHEIHHRSLREGVEKGLVAPFSVIIAQTDVSIANVSHTPVKGYDKKGLERAINVAGRNQAAVELYKQLLPNQEKAIFFCAGIKHAEEMARLFNAAGISAAAIYGESPRRKEILADSASGKIRVLCGADLLKRGHDDPELMAAFLLAESQSVVQVTQSGGRATRMLRDLETGAIIPKHALVVHFIDKFTDPAAAPVLFSDIAGDAEILGPSSESNREGGEGKRTRTIPPILNIPGLKVTVATHEVMRITRSMKEEKERASLKPNTAGWFEINGQEYGTLAQCAKGLGLQTRDLEAYVQQAEQGGRTFTTEERYVGGKTIDLFLRTEIGEFIAERTKPQEKTATQEEGPIIIKPNDPMIFLKDGIPWATLEALAKELNKSTPDIKKILATSEIPHLPADRQFYYQKVAGDPKSSIVLRHAGTTIYPYEESLAFVTQTLSTKSKAAEEERQRKAIEKAQREKIEKRGWVIEDGKVYVTGEWAIKNFEIPKKFQGQDGLRGIVRGATPRVAVPGIVVKFFLLDSIRVALIKAQPYGYNATDQAWQATVATRTFDFTEEDESKPEPES